MAFSGLYLLRFTIWVNNPIVALYKFHNIFITRNAFLSAKPSTFQGRGCGSKATGLVYAHALQLSYHERAMESIACAVGVDGLDREHWIAEMNGKKAYAMLP